MAALAVLPAVAAAASAGFVRADFNDLPAGVGLVGRGGGTGFSGNWAGTGTISTPIGDLASPLYGVDQPSPARSVYGSYYIERQCNRALAEAMGGTIWFSFLVNNPNAASQAGLLFNSNDPYLFNGDASVRASGTDLVVELDGTPTTVASQFALNQTALVVGQLVVGAGSDTLNVWVDPNLYQSTDMATHPTAFADSGQDFASSVVRIAVGSGVTGGKVDAILLSDGPNGLYDVTHVPEPATLLLTAAGLLGCAWRRRKRR
jgi:hypothetical protein